LKQKDEEREIRKNEHVPDEGKRGMETGRAKCGSPSVLIYGDPYGSICVERQGSMQRMKELALAGAVACSAGDRSDGSLALRCGRPWP